MSHDHKPGVQPCSARYFKNGALSQRTSPPEPWSAQSLMDLNRSNQNRSAFEPWSAASLKDSLKWKRIQEPVFEPWSAQSIRNTKTMSRDWEAVFTTWSTGPSATETMRAENAERQVRAAISASDKLRNRDIRVFTQGSYRNRVNVRKNSDVDVGVVCFDSYFPIYPEDENAKAKIQDSFEPATYVYATFKNELEEALVAHFGRDSVKRSPKAFDIKENSYRVEADVVAFFEHRRYTSEYHYHSGVEMRPDDANPFRIINWPEQHYENGVDKNTMSYRRFKRVVRILKNLSNEMDEKGIESAKKTPSFLVECLVWNTPNEHLALSTYRATIRATLAHLFNQTLNDEDCSGWGEVSELKYLFRGTQPWARASAHQFISDAWDYIGFE